MDSRATPSKSLIGPSRTNSIRAHEKKPYDRPVSKTGGSEPLQGQAPGGLFGGLKRGLSRWFGSGPDQDVEHADHHSSPKKDTMNEARGSRSPSERGQGDNNAKRSAPQLSPNRSTPNKKPRRVSPGSLSVHGRAVESFNVKEYHSSRLPTRLNGSTNFARPMDSSRGGTPSGITRSRTIGGYNDPPLALLASPSRTSRMTPLAKDLTSLQVTSRSGTAIAGSPMKSPLYVSSGGRGLTRSTTALNLLPRSDSSHRLSSPARNVKGSLESPQMNRTLREGSLLRNEHATLGSPSRSKRSVNALNNGKNRDFSPRRGAPNSVLRQETAEMSRSGSHRDMSVSQPPLQYKANGSRSHAEERYEVDIKAEQEEHLQSAEDDEMDASYDTSHSGNRRDVKSKSHRPRDSTQVAETSDQTVEAELILKQLAEMRRSSRHSNIQTGQSTSSLQKVPVPASLSNRELRRLHNVKVPKASPAQEEAKLHSSLNDKPIKLSLRLVPVEKGKDSVMPYGRKPLEKPSKIEEEKQNSKKDVGTRTDNSTSNDEPSSAPFTFSMDDPPKKASNPLNITFSSNATNVVRSDGPSTLRARSAVTKRTHASAPQMAATKQRANTFSIPDDDEMEGEDDELDLEPRQRSVSAQPVAESPPPPQIPSPKRKKELDVTSVRKARGFLDVGAVSKPRKRHPLSATPLNASSLSEYSPMKQPVPTGPPTTTAAKIPDFFAMPAKAPAFGVAAEPSSGKSALGLGLGRPGAPSIASLAPAVSVTAPSPVSSPVAPSKVATAPIFTFGSSAPSVPSVPSAPSNFFSKPASETSAAPLKDTPSASETSVEKHVDAPKAPFSFSKLPSAVPPSAPVASSGFTFTAPKAMPSLFGNTGSASTPLPVVPTAPPAETLKSGPIPPASTPSTTSFSFGGTATTSAVPASNTFTFGSTKPADKVESASFTFGSAKPAETENAPANKTPTTFSFGQSTSSTSGSLFGGDKSIKPATGFTFGTTTPGTQPVADPFKSVNNNASSIISQPAPSPVPTTTGFNFGATPAPAPSAGFSFDFGSKPSTRPASPASFVFGSTASNDKPVVRTQSPAPFTFGATVAKETAKPALNMFGNASAPTAQPANNFFGSAAPPTNNPFGAVPTATNTASVPAFGGFGQQTAAPVSNMFGNPTTSIPSPSMFGGFGSTAPQQNTNGSMFGSTPAPISAPSANAGFNFNMGSATPAPFAGADDPSRNPSPAFSIGAGDSPGGRKIRKLPTTRKK